MKALILGSTGFIGKNLIDYLKKMEIEYDTIGRNWYETLTGKGNYDLVFYLAGEVRNPSEMFEANVKLLYRALSCSLNWDNCVFVYVGSSSEYGRMNRPMRESDPINPTNMYEATKGCGTLLCQGFAKQFGKPVAILRPSSLYGKYERPEKFIPTVIRKLKAGEQVDLYEGVHDWLYVEDFIRAIFAVLLNGKLDGEIYNVSSGKQIANWYIAKKIAETLGSSKMFTYKQEKFHAHDTADWLVDNTKIKSIGWKPQYDIYSGLEKTVREILEGEC